MRIEIDTLELTEDEAIGVVMLLVSIRPTLTVKLAELTGDQITITHTVGDVSLTGTGTAEALAAAEVFTPPADAAFTAPLAVSTADGATGQDGSTEPSSLAAAPAAGSPDTLAQLDKDGWPHDARIHSENPTLTTKGTWRARRFKTDADRKAAEAATHAELRAKGYGVPSAAPANPSPVSAAPASAASPDLTASSPAAPSSAPAATVGGEAASPPAEAVSAAEVPAPPPVPATPALPAELAPSAAAPTAPAAATAVNPMVRFTGIMQRVTAAQGATPPKITQDDVTGILAGLGLDSMRALAIAPPETMDGFEATFNAMVGA